MTRILLTGFNPFDGRSINASWVAAAQLQQHGSIPSVVIRAVELPVEWGRPAAMLEQQIADFRPEIVIAMGEGKPGCFRLETLAINQRVARVDNTGRLPADPAIDRTGPGHLQSRAPLLEIRRLLQGRGIPVLLSIDAGSFLCEETLFSLELLAAQHNSIKLAMFVHLPPYGTSLLFKQKSRCCDHELLLEFAEDLMAGVLQVQGISA